MESLIENLHYNFDICDKQRKKKELYLKNESTVNTISMKKIVHLLNLFFFLFSFSSMKIIKVTKKRKNKETSNL